MAVLDLGSVVYAVYPRNAMWSVSVSCRAMMSGEFCCVSGRSEACLLRYDRQFHCHISSDDGGVESCIGILEGVIVRREGRGCVGALGSGVLFGLFMGFALLFFNDD